MNGRTITTAPINVIGAKTYSERDPRPIRSRPAPTATKTAFKTLRSPEGSSGAGTDFTPMTATTPITAVRGRSPRNTHRQPTVSAIQAAITGPITDGSIQALEIKANICGRCSSGYIRPMQTYDVAGIAPAPTPCRKRPRTNTIMVGAIPPATRPTAKIMRPTMKGRAGRIRSAAVPAITTPTSVPRKNALKTHPYSARSPRSDSTTGMTVATDIDSKATNVTISTRPEVSNRRSGEKTPPALTTPTRAPEAVSGTCHRRRIGRAPPPGFEPGTCRVETGCSIQLSYGGRVLSKRTPKPQARNSRHMIPFRARALPVVC